MQQLSGDGPPGPILSPLKLPPDTAPGRAHLHSLYDNGEGVVLAVAGQLVLADPTEGEVPVIKALEVGLSCDKTLSCRAQRKEEEQEEWSGRDGSLHLKMSSTKKLSQAPFLKLFAHSFQPHFIKAATKGSDRATL